MTGWNPPCHLDDVRRADTGEQMDLVGGWHQSGDLRKWMMGTPYGLTGLAKLGLLRNPRWEQGQIADELRWGNRYFQGKVILAGLSEGILSQLERTGLLELIGKDKIFMASYELANQAFDAVQNCLETADHKELPIEKEE